MSRAFVREDQEPTRPARQLGLSVDDPSYDAAAALTLLEGARDGDIEGAEAATGYRWGAGQLHEHVRRLMAQEEARPEHERDTRFIRVAQRFLSDDGR
jgi:hypothetical protein